MQFGYVNLLEQPEHRDYAGLLDDLREQAVLCDEAGWDHVWLGEHHFGPSGHDNSPNPFMIAADLGARTRRIRLGIAVVVLPLWHPLRVAENVALLDQMHRGRVEIGFGRASQPHEVVTFNPAADPRNEAGSREIFAESLAVVRKACTERFFSHKGKHYELPPPGVTWASREGVEEDPEWIRGGTIQRLCVVPKPYQRPHPPFWMAVSSAPSVEVCAELGLKALAWRQSPRMLKTWIDRYAKVFADKGMSVAEPGRSWGVLRNVYVAPTMEQARRDYEPALMSSLRYRAADPWRALRAHLDPGEEPSPDMRLDWDFLQGRSLIAGSPEYVAEHMVRLGEFTGIRTLLSGIASHGLEHRKIMRCLELLSEEVLPHTRKALASRDAASTPARPADGSDSRAPAAHIRSST